MCPLRQYCATDTDYYRLYIKNLNDKINKSELKRALYMLFSTYGPVLDIVTARIGAKKQSMRGQAHVVYRDIQTSTQAMRALQGFDLFGKEMVSVARPPQERYLQLLGHCLRQGTVEHHPQAARHVRATSGSDYIRGD